MAVEKQFGHIEFSRLRDFVNLSLPEKLDEITYVANATNFRRCMMNSFGKEELDIEDEIANNPDTKMTYLGYRRFLESDLRYIFPLGTGRSSTSYKKDVRYLAQQMLIRGYVSTNTINFGGIQITKFLTQAFAEAVKYAFPNHLRLSIHKSTGDHKISMSLLNTKTGFTTPWHCSVALMADGEWLSAPMGDFKKDPRFEIVYENGHSSYFKEVTGELAHPKIPVYQGTEVRGKQSQTKSKREGPKDVLLLNQNSGELSMKSKWRTVTSYSTYLNLYIEPFSSYLVADSLRSITGYFLFYKGNDAVMALEFGNVGDRSIWNNFRMFWAYVVFNIGAAVALYWLARGLLGKRKRSVRMIETTAKRQIGLRLAS